MYVCITQKSYSPSRERFAAPRAALRPARARLGAVLVSSFLVVAPGCAEAPEAAAKNAGGRITVAAASSLAAVTQDLLTRWEAEGGALSL